MTLWCSVRPCSDFTTENAEFAEKIRKTLRSLCTLR
jgi:hypothetical protein